MRVDVKIEDKKEHKFLKINIDKIIDIEKDLWANVKDKLAQTTSEKELISQTQFKR